jgi:hypothetical protein
MLLQGKRVLAFVDEEFEDLEMWYPVLRLREEGAVVDIVGPEKGKKYIGKYGVPIVAEYAFGDVQANDYDGLYVASVCGCVAIDSGNSCRCETDWAHLSCGLGVSIREDLSGLHDDLDARH